MTSLDRVRGGEVENLLRRAAAEIIQPLYGRSDPQEKGPGDWVTRADRETEAFLTEHLPAFLPGSVVVGEEAAHADPTVLDRLSGAAPVWVLDPVDGTSNYAHGTGPFAVMAALIVDGATVAGWIYLVTTDEMLSAYAGQGARCNGEAFLVDSAPRPGISGWLPDQFLADAKAPHRQVSRPGCAGQEYPDVVRGRYDFAPYWRTWPWDHAPGALIATEAGAIVRRLDGSEYSPVDYRTKGLLLARTQEVWDQVRACFPDAVENRGEDS